MPCLARFHPQLAKALVTGLRGALEAASIRVVDGPSDLELVEWRERLPAPRPAPPRIAALYDGALGQRVAEALARPDAPLLLARRAEGSLPAVWELRAIAALFSDHPVFSAVDAAWNMREVSGLGDLDVLFKACVEATRKSGVPSRIAQRAGDVLYELAANALLDAPVDGSGKPKYAFDRGAHLVIAPEDRCFAGWAFSGDHVFLLAHDKFGRFLLDAMARAVGRFGDVARVDTSGGGASLGLRRILEHSELIATRVITGRSTEVLCAVRRTAGDARSAPKSLCFVTREGRA